MSNPCLICLHVHLFGRGRRPVPRALASQRRRRRLRMLEAHLHEEFFAGGQTSAILPHPSLFLSRRLNSDEGGLPAKWKSLLHHEDFFADGESVILPPPLLFLVGVSKKDDDGVPAR